jgi:hypothetical protein
MLLRCVAGAVASQRWASGGSAVVHKEVGAGLLRGRHAEPSGAFVVLELSAKSSVSDAAEALVATLKALRSGCVDVQRAVTRHRVAADGGVGARRRSHRAADQLHNDAVAR